MKKFPTVNPEHYVQALEQHLSNHLNLIDKLLTTNKLFTWDNLMHQLERMDDDLERFWSPLNHLHAVVNSKALRVCYESCLPKLSSYHTAIGHNQTLYQAIQSIDLHSLNAYQKKIIEDTLRGFRLTGVALSTKDKQRFEEIESRLSALSNQFANQVLDATQAFTYHIPTEDAERLLGIPEHAVSRAAACAAEENKSGWLFNLELPSYLAIVTYAEDRALRETIYHAYITRASELGPQGGQFDNSDTIRELLELRHEKATLLGYPHFAAYSLATKMAESSDQVIDFLQDLCGRARAQAEKEFKELGQFAQTEYGLSSVEPWDIAYLSEKRKQALFSISEEALRAYFPLPKVMEGLFAIVQQLFGIQCEMIACEAWHPDVICYEIRSEEGHPCGYLYLDLFARPHKQGGAWMDSSQSRFKRSSHDVQLPIATLTCNFAAAVPGQSPTLSHQEVVTLFHEFGHCLHHVLSNVDYWTASGNHGVEWDAVELPSQFLENWCWEEESLQQLSAHVTTGECLPKAMLQQMIAAKNFQSALKLMRQLEFALFDFLLHQKPGGYPKDVNSVQDTLAQVRQQTTIVPVAPFNRFTHSFSHIFAGGYAAGYYSYLWAEVLSSDAFSRFEEEGLFNTKTGRDFLHHILEVGSGCSALDAFVAFRGRKPQVDALLRHHHINKKCNFSLCSK